MLLQIFFQRRVESVDEGRFNFKPVIAILHQNSELFFLVVWWLGCILISNLQVFWVEFVVSYHFDRYLLQLLLAWVKVGVPSLVLWVRLAQRNLYFFILRFSDAKPEAVLWLGLAIYFVIDKVVFSLGWIFYLQLLLIILFWKCTDAIYFLILYNFHFLETLFLTSWIPSNQVSCWILSNLFGIFLNFKLLPISCIQSWTKVFVRIVGLKLLAWSISWDAVALVLGWLIIRLVFALLPFFFWTSFCLFRSLWWFHKLALV